MENKSFEGAQKRIEEIIEDLEEGNLPLRESIDRFKEAAELLKFCDKELKEVEKIGPKKAKDIKKALEKFKEAFLRYLPVRFVMIKSAMAPVDEATPPDLSRFNSLNSKKGVSPIVLIASFISKFILKFLTFLCKNYIACII